MQRKRAANNRLIEGEHARAAGPDGTETLSPLEAIQLQMLEDARRYARELHELELERQRHRVATAKAKRGLWERIRQRVEEVEDLESLPQLRLGKN